MTSPISQTTPLPADVAISEYSRKFYDGTYKWTSEGFIDENGGKWDSWPGCDLPAPTPLPPMDLGDYDEDMEYVENQDSPLPTRPLDKTSTPSADQHQRKDSLATSQAGQSKVASSSPLSDYPSDMSEEDPTSIQEDTAVKKTTLVESEQEKSDTPEYRPTTRGVAQKVKKSSKRPPAKRANKSSPPVKSSQTGSYTEGSGTSSRRRSARQAKTQGAGS
ncbi:hypothetical protein PTT_18847 [Pyrenophora teres f. teres 0-1]|uniref:Uncharacterized protein n=1 Tax=Pyrenophora teres f. teres (strain 0-1) TaxID=861557 RepID=E3S7N7_PYRTT|nr:hypothetical protein PTT_18847 [Pyrenophora teres f. teres 0-1]